MIPPPHDPQRPADALTALSDASSPPPLGTTAASVLRDHESDLYDAGQALEQAVELMAYPMMAATAIEHVKVAQVVLARTWVVLGTLRQALERDENALVELRSIARTSVGELYDGDVPAADLVRRADAALRRRGALA